MYESSTCPFIWNISKESEIFLTLDITIQYFEAIQKAHPAKAENGTAHPHE